MPLAGQDKQAFDEALDRLKNFYDGQSPYDPVSNPGGFRRGGNVVNFAPALEDVADVGRGVGILATDVSQAAGSAATAVSAADRANAAANRAEVTVDSKLSVLGRAIDVSGITVPTALPIFRTTGYNRIGDGGDAAYVPVSAKPAHDGFLRDAAGKYFEIAAVAPNVRSFGARGDGAGDDGPAFNRLAAYLKAKGGGAFVIPPGRYRIVTPVLIDVTDNADEVVGRGIAVVGAGMSCTTIICATGNSFAMEIRATVTVAGNSSFNSHQQVSGLKFVSPGINVGNGLLMNTTAICDLSWVAAINLDVGVKTNDIHTANFYDCHLRYNKVGHLGVAQINLSSPNAFSYFGCNINGNIDWGCVLQNASVMNFFGGTIEFNGLASALAQSGGIRLSAPGRNGTVAVNCYGAWFEANAGVADVWCDHGAYYATYNFDGCIFNRTNNTIVINGATYKYYADNNILLIVPAGGSARLNVKNCGFKGWNNYPADASRAYIKITGGGAANVIFSEDGNRYDNAIEAPTAASGRLLARARLSGSGAIQASWNIASVTRTDTGRYKVTFVDPGRRVPGRTIIGAVDIIGTVRLDSEDATSLSFSVINNGQFADPGAVMIAIYE